MADFYIVLGTHNPVSCPIEEYTQEPPCVVQDTDGLDHNADVSHACCMLIGGICMCRNLLHGPEYMGTRMDSCSGLYEICPFHGKYQCSSPAYSCMYSCEPCKLCTFIFLIILCCLLLGNSNVKGSCIARDRVGHEVTRVIIKNLH